MIIEIYLIVRLMDSLPLLMFSFITKLPIRTELLKATWLLIPTMVSLLIFSATLEDTPLVLQASSIILLELTFVVAVRSSFIV